MRRSETDFFKLESLEEENDPFEAHENNFHDSENSLAHLKMNQES